MSVYRVTEVIGVSPKSWEDAAQQAVTVASRSLRDLRVAEVVEQDLTLTEAGAIESFRTKLRLSFKYEQPLGAPEWEGQAAERPVEA
jgi:flavin-binding protein dodecin